LISKLYVVNQPVSRTFVLLYVAVFFRDTLVRRGPTQFGIQVGDISFPTTLVTLAALLDCIRRCPTRGITAARLQDTITGE
jgi:hypothetical protein